MKTVKVCDRCGSSACLDSGAPTCSYDGAVRGETEIAVAKYERSEGAPKPVPVRRTTGRRP